MQSSEQKLLRFGWLAPDFDPKMCLAGPYQNRGQVSQYRVRRQCCGNEVDGGKCWAFMADSCYTYSRERI